MDCAICNRNRNRNRDVNRDWPLKNKRECAIVSERKIMENRVDEGEDLLFRLARDLLLRGRFRKDLLCLD